MWESRDEALTESVRRFSILRDGERTSCREIAERWIRDAVLRGFFIDLLAGAGFAAYFWETPPVTAGSLDRPFEFVLVDGPALAGMRADPAPFADRFRTEAGEGIAAFPNLGGDAFLIAPCPRGNPSAYPHLAAFVRAAPEAQRHALWRATGDELLRRVSARPIWLSTSGLGVAWVHVRLDSSPKYYTFEPYRDPSPWPGAI